MLLERVYGKSQLNVLLILFCIFTGSNAETQNIQHQETSLDLHTKAKWRLLSPAAGTRSALRILRAANPQTKNPYDNSTNVFGCNPADLRRTFHLEKNELLLGEPILVEFRVELHGPGQWQEPIGGNYRSRGRDDNFLFLMRHKGEVWVPDRYTRGGGIGGGLSTSISVKQNKPLSYWFGVQQWCAIDDPGTYELYCFQTAREYTVVGQRRALTAAIPDGIKNKLAVGDHGVLIDTGTGSKPLAKYRPAIRRQRHEWPPSPLVREIPPDVLARAGRSWYIESVMDFAHFTIVIRTGSAQERQEMIRYWTSVAESGSDRVMPAKRAAAARKAISFAQQDDFLPLIEEWIADASQPGAFFGLAMRPSPAATRILLRSANPNAVSAMRHLHHDRIPDVVPQLIEWLTHEDQRMRTESEHRLVTWTGQTFRSDRRGYDYRRPTMEEARKTQPLWRKWWHENKDGFEPKAQ